MFKLSIQEIESFKKAWEGDRDSNDALEQALLSIKQMMAQGSFAKAMDAIDDLILATKNPNAYLQKLEEQKSQNV